jgi:hypothetical protein
MLAQARPLGLDRVDELSLLCRPGGKSGVEWAEVLEVATAHLSDLFVMATVERRQPTAPAQRLGMAGVASLACGQDRPDRMKLPVLTQQVLVAKVSGVDIPDAHGAEPTGYAGARVGRASTRVR